MLIWGAPISLQSIKGYWRGAKSKRSPYGAGQGRPVNSLFFPVRNLINFSLPYGIAEENGNLTKLKGDV